MRYPDILLPIIILIRTVLGEDEVLSLFNELLESRVHIAALFTKECCTCTECVEAEALLTAAFSDLQNTYGITTVKLTSRKDLQSQYGVSTVPSLVFIRDNVPALYDGTFEPEPLYEWFSQSMEPSIKELDDSSFEHLTQASTGATTGDWLAVFYDTSCKNEQSLLAIAEGAASRLKNKVNVAMVDKSKSQEIVSRFKVKDCPSIIFFRLGKMYRYNLPDINVPSLRRFSEGWYKNSKAEVVPAPTSPFDKLVEEVAELIKEHKLLASVVIGSGLLLAVIVLYSSMKKEKKIEEKKSN